MRLISLTEMKGQQMEVIGNQESNTLACYEHRSKENKERNRKIKEMDVVASAHEENWVTKG